MGKETLYLLVHNMFYSLSNNNCLALGLPLGSDYNFFKSALGKYCGIFKKKNGLDIWVAPFWVRNDLVMENIEGVDEIITKEELENYGFDEPEDII